jgi:hypothetical protein
MGGTLSSRPGGNQLDGSGSEVAAASTADSAALASVVATVFVAPALTAVFAKPAVATPDAFAASDF